MARGHVCLLVGAMSGDSIKLLSCLPSILHACPTTFSDQSALNGCPLTLEILYVYSGYSCPTESLKKDEPG